MPEEDEEMEGVEGDNAVKPEGEEDDVSEAGSEDLEADTSGSEDEEEGEEEGEEGEGDGDVEMGEGEDGEAKTGRGGKVMQGQHEVMVH